MSIFSFNCSSTDCRVCADGMPPAATAPDIWYLQEEMARYRSISTRDNIKAQWWSPSFTELKVSSVKWRRERKRFILHQWLQRVDDEISNRPRPTLPNQPAPPEASQWASFNTVRRLLHPAACCRTGLERKVQLGERLHPWRNKITGNCMNLN